jgi:chromosome segregation ATPase
MAIGLMVTYANVATSIDKLCFDDDVATFEQKISCLDTLEENGFNVGQFRSRMKKLLQIKTDHTGNHLKKAELETQLAQKESANASVLLELDKVGFELTELRKKVNFLVEQRGKLAVEGQKLSNLTAGLENEIPQLRDQISEARMLRESARANFEKLLAEPL